MKVLLSFLFLFLMKATYLDVQEIVTPPLKPITAFNVGEILTYQIRYGIVVAGTTTLSLTEEMYKRKMVFHAFAVGQTTGLANTIYGVKDIYESWFDKKTNLPYKQVRSIKEGSYKQYDEVTYNRAKNTVESQLTGEHKVPDKILDLASTLYYIRFVGNVLLKLVKYENTLNPLVIEK
jgi:hypothetical protein